MGFLEKKPIPKLDTHKHSSIRKADPYGFQISHHRLAWLFRLSVGTNIALVISLVAALNAFSVLFPMKEVRVALLRVDPADNKLYRVEPLVENIDNFELVLEQATRRFVRNLLEIDRITQSERFKEAFAMMDDRFYNKFWKNRIESGKVEDALDSGLTRSIMIESVQKIETSEPVYKFAVDFVQTDERGNEIIKQKAARAYLTLTTRPYDVRPEDVFENPHGIIILDLVLKEKANI